MSVPIPYPQSGWSNLVGESSNLTIVRNVHQCRDNDHLSIIIITQLTSNSPNFLSSIYGVPSWVWGFGLGV